MAISFFSILSLLLSLPLFTQSQSPNRGQWTLLQHSIGISAMHMQLLNTNDIVIFDRTEVGPSNLSLPVDRCLNNDCTAHSLLYHIPSNTVRPLTLSTDTWCSSGALLPDGTLLQTGGYNTGDRVVRTLPTDQNSDWTEHPDSLSVRRWYATDQILPDGRVIIVGGRRQFNYEFFPKESSSSSSADNHLLGFLVETRDGVEENNLYPFLHLLPDGNLFIFANSRAISFNYTAGRVVREFPPIPGGEPRNYPCSGSSVLLPLRLDAVAGGDVAAEILVCGGAPRGAYLHGRNGTFLPALSDCARIVVSDPDPKWTVEKMPMARVMGDMVLLPTGDVIIINGAESGSAGWELGRGPVLNPVLYRTYEPGPDRFMVLGPSPIPRMYHSTAVMLPDGRVFVGGSNPHRRYNFTDDVKYPTELSVEAFSPPYLAAEHDLDRARITLMKPQTGEFLRYGEAVKVGAFMRSYDGGLNVAVAMLAPSFTTHGVGMNQRMMVLEMMEITLTSQFTYEVTAVAPPTTAVAPPGWYLLFVLHVGVPSHGVWVRIQE